MYTYKGLGEGLIGFVYTPGHHVHENFHISLSLCFAEMFLRPIVQMAGPKALSELTVVRPS